MPEGVAAAASHVQRSQLSFPTTLLESLRIFSRNKLLFFSIFSLIALPLSLLLFSLSSSSHYLKSEILSLEYLAAQAHTRFEARHVWRESRDYGLSLLRLKFFYFLPSYLLSLFLAVTAVISTDTLYHGKPITLRAAVSGVKLTWMRPFATSICVYVVLLLYAGAVRTLAGTLGRTSSGLRWVIRVGGSAVEMYIIAVSAMALVVSIMETRFGWEAIRVGSGLMEGRRFGGWVLSVLLGLVTGWIGSRMESLMMDGGDSSAKLRWTTVMGIEEDWERLALIGLYAAVMVWSFVVVTVFYCESKKRHVVREVDVNNIDEDSVL